MDKRKNKQIKFLNVILSIILLAMPLLLYGCLAGSDLGTITANATIQNPANVKILNSDNVGQGLSMSSRGELRVHNTTLIENIGIHGTWEGHQGYSFSIMGQRQVWASTTQLNDIVSFNTGNLSYTELNGTENLEVVSTSTSDNLTGTGARRIVIVYLNTTNNITESSPITMNGTTPVALPFKANFIEWAEVTQVGSNTVSVGDIVVRNVALPGVNYELINAGGNKSLSARFRVPAGYKGFLESWGGNCVAATAQYVDLRLRTTTNTLTGTLDTPYHFVDTMYSQGGSTMMQMTLPFIEVPALGDVKISAIPSALNNVRVDVSYIIVLIAQ